ncbi:hypothetical protein, partial [uncultured Parabacteroides sp.]|uniref:hypothetical protein n=1 Tax=uncultured Parabacteroides sp. TaxID=512312 RepID=UPI002805058E
MKQIKADLNYFSMLVIIVQGCALGYVLSGSLKTRLSSYRRLSFAVCFSRRIGDCSGFAGSSVGFN